MSKYTDEERLDRACLRVAMHIRGLYEERGSSDTRLLEALFIPDEFTVVGQSEAYAGKGRREHVVPRRVIVKECHEMLRNGRDDAEIARFIKDHVKIVLITPEECERLDRKVHYGLRQSMPKGWVVGDDVFARLVTAGISWTPNGD